jgi:hypothetical protein
MHSLMVQVEVQVGAWLMHLFMVQVDYKLFGQVILAGYLYRLVHGWCTFLWYRMITGCLVHLVTGWLGCRSMVHVVTMVYLLMIV